MKQEYSPYTICSNVDDYGSLKSVNNIKFIESEKLPENAPIQPFWKSLDLLHGDGFVSQPLSVQISAAALVRYLQFRNMYRKGHGFEPFDLIEFVNTVVMFSFSNPTCNVNELLSIIVYAIPQKDGMRCWLDRFVMYDDVLKKYTITSNFYDCLVFS